MKGFLRLALMCALVAGMSACAGRAPQQEHWSAARLPANGQLLLVLAQDWNATSGELRYYDRSASGWTLVKGPLFVNLGRNGLAWGRGLEQGDLAGLSGTDKGAAPDKREGDGRAPVGAFALDEGFAYDPAEAGPVKLPVLQADKDLLCVDDVASPHYNAFVRQSAVAKDWNSAEDMLRADGQYRFGVMVRHNMDPVRPGGGSCIFMHIWLRKGYASSGCTNMAPENMLALLHWLDSSRQPTLVQLPVAVYRTLRTAWSLPEVEIGTK